MVGFLACESRAQRERGSLLEEAFDMRIDLDESDVAYSKITQLPSPCPVVIPSFAPVRLALDVHYAYAFFIVTELDPVRRPSYRSY